MTAKTHVTQIRFRSTVLQPTPSELSADSEEYINSETCASALADRVAKILGTHRGVRFERHLEDFGILFACRSEAPFEIQVVCTNLQGGDETKDEHLVFVEPARKALRRFPWIRSQPTAPWVPDLVAHLSDGLKKYPDVTELTLVPHDQPL